jgi:hypothetical protein
VGWKAPHADLMFAAGPFGLAAFFMLSELLMCDILLRSVEQGPDLRGLRNFTLRQLLLWMFMYVLWVLLLAIVDSSAVPGLGRLARYLTVRGGAAWRFRCRSCCTGEVTRSSCATRGLVYRCDLCNLIHSPQQAVVGTAVVRPPQAHVCRRSGNALLVTTLRAAFPLHVIERSGRSFRMRVQAGAAGPPSETGWSVDHDPITPASFCVAHGLISPGHHGGDIVLVGKILG